MDTTGATRRYLNGRHRSLVRLSQNWRSRCLGLERGWFAQDLNYQANSHHYRKDTNNSKFGPTQTARSLRSQGYVEDDPRLVSLEKRTRYRRLMRPTVGRKLTA